MSSVSAFGNWLLATRETRLTSANEIINDASLNTYLLGDFLANRDVSQVVRGGSYISERVKLSSQNNFQSYTPGQQRNSSRVQTVRELRFGWRFHENSIPYTDAETDLNEGDDFAKFKSFEKILRMDLKDDHYKGLENLLFQQPDAGAMEGVTQQGGKAFSIPAFVSENNTDFHAPGWTTVAGLDPATFDQWRNQIEYYNPAAMDDRATGLFAAFDRMMLDVEFVPPPNAQSYFESPSMRRMMIVTNKDGRARYQQLLRDGNDRFMAGSQDPSYGSPVWQGIPVRYAATLDTALLNENPRGTYTGTAYPDGRPRYFFLHTGYLFPVFHPKHFMDLTPPIAGGVTQRDTETLFMVSWCQIVCRSRRRQGIVAPTTTA